MPKTTKKKIKLVVVCDKCFLIDCCCEADRLQVIKDDEDARARGYAPVDVKRWINK